MTKRITVKGAVQGIGYRPFISEKATEYGLKGYVKNCGASVEILVSGDDVFIEGFISDLEKEVPAGGFILALDVKDANEDDLKVNGFNADSTEKSGFDIIESSQLDLSSEIPVFLPDIGICDDCLGEMLDPDNRRYRYPLISCAVCGPRMSILNRLPYDRNNTTMEDFDMCPECSRDYGIGRRKYAQTISCHDCGPQMLFLTGNKNKDTDDAPLFEQIYRKDDAVKKAAEVLKAGGIIGLKGISGYQLVCLPESEPAARLRSVKGRENKPFAVMYPTIDAIKKDAYVSDLEAELLKSSARPIVLLKKNREFSGEVDRGSRYIGAFLPSAGIHRLLCDELGALIVTSGNRSDEPMITDDKVFEDIFGNRIDGILCHKRKINMAQDDSVMFVIEADGREYAQFIRRARGFAPLPIVLETDMDNNCSGVPGEQASILALGGDLKSSFAFAKRDRIMPSQYIGDLGDYETSVYYENLLKDYRRIFEFDPTVLVMDLHPLYISGEIGRRIGDGDNIKIVNLQHHFAHIYSVMAENSLNRSIGVSFDGTGYGTDERIWGGEFVLCDGASATRLGHLSYVKLTGGDEAPKNALNVAKCYINECVKIELIPDKNVSLIDEDPGTYQLIKAALDSNINTFETSSMGRLFDAVSALLGVCCHNSYEGECAVLLEKKAHEFMDKGGAAGDYPEFMFEISSDGECNVADQISLFADIYNCACSRTYDTEAISYGFHRAVIRLIIQECILMRDETKISKISLSGGVFNNRIILAGAVDELLKNGFEVYWNRKVPLGDGGISTGQAYYGLLREY